MTTTITPTPHEGVKTPMAAQIRQAAAYFRENDYFTLLCHANPDGDTLGCGFGLCGVLHLLGKYARVLCCDVPSTRFDFLKDAVNPELMKFPETFPDGAAETIVTVDIADTTLLGTLAEKYPVIDFCIDHHISNKNYAKQTLLDAEAAACAELVWEVIKELISEYKLKTSSTGTAIAAAIYTGVSTDTGCFSFANTTARTHSTAAELMSYGIDILPINYYMFEMKTKARIALEQRAMSNMEYYFDGKCAMTVITADMLSGIDPEDANNVSRLPKQVEGVEVGVVIKEKLRTEADCADCDVQTWKVSLRTGGTANAQLISSSLGGGGHVRAAGCTIKGSLEQVRSKILTEIGKQL